MGKKARDRVIADKRALGSFRSQQETLAKRMRRRHAEQLADAETLGAAFIKDCERHDRLVAAGVEVAPPTPPFARVGRLGAIVLPEHRPRKRMNLRRSPEQIEAEEKRRREEWERSGLDVLPSVPSLPTSSPLGPI